MKLRVILIALLMLLSSVTVAAAGPTVVTSKYSELQTVQTIYSNAVAVTTSDSTAVAYNALWVGGAGNIKVDTPNQTGVTFTGVTAGTLLPVQVIKVYATGTTATNMVGLN